MRSMEKHSCAPVFPNGSPVRNSVAKLVNAGKEEKSIVEHLVNQLLFKSKPRDIPKQKTRTHKYSASTISVISKQNCERSASKRTSNQRQQQTSCSTTFINKCDSGNIKFANFFPLNGIWPSELKALRCINFCLDHQQIDCEICNDVKKKNILSKCEALQHLKQDQVDICQNNVEKETSFHDACTTSRTMKKVSQNPKHRYRGKPRVEQLPNNRYVERTPSEEMRRSEIDKYSNKENGEMIALDRSQNNVRKKNTSDDHLKNGGNPDVEQIERICNSSKTDRQIREQSSVKKSTSCAKELTSNHKANSSCFNQGRSRHSTFSESPTSYPFRELSVELPSTSTYVSFYTPNDALSIEFFTPTYSPRSVCSKYDSVQIFSPKSNSSFKNDFVEAISSKRYSSNSPKCISFKNNSLKCPSSSEGVDLNNECDNFASLRGIPNNLANLEIPLVDENDISYCRKQNGAAVSIGQGVYGGVYLADLKGNPCKVVIKEFVSSASSSENHIIKEAKILSHLQSTGFVPELIGITRSSPESQLVLVQEFFGDGVTLGKLLSGKPSLSYRSWICIFFQMATGLYYIHSKGVLHNDIQTGNILVDVDHAFYKTKFIDFGLASYRRGHRFGTNRNYLLQFDHLAPEVQNGARTTFRSDVFSLGWVMGTIAQTMKMDNDVIWDAIEDMTNERPENRPFTDELCSIFKKPLLQELDNI